MPDDEIRDPFDLFSQACDGFPRTHPTSNNDDFDIMRHVCTRLGITYEGDLVCRLSKEMTHADEHQ